VASETMAQSEDDITVDQLALTTSTCTGVGRKHIKGRAVVVGNDRSSFHWLTILL